MPRIVRWVFAIIGALLGIPLGNVIIEQPVLMGYISSYLPNNLYIYGILMLLFAIITYFIYPLIMSFLRKATVNFENALRGTSIIDFSMQLMGLTIGLILAALISSAFNSFPVPGFQWIITVSIYIVLGYLGWTLPRNRTDEVRGFINRFRRSNRDSAPTVQALPPVKRPVVKRKNTLEGAKLLDTSVIIDGRIIDIFKTQFVEGPLLIPVYVLNELQLISDSADDLKRSKGRRGLDIVAQLQEDSEGNQSVRILDEDYPDIKEVDAKLIRTAKEKKCKIITNDYNLNKLASVQGITILNINDLANAVKTVVLPGEDISVSLLKAGKEPGQAVGYLEDGTMIVVEHGRSLIGSTLSVLVTSVLQTSAGRMIFAKPKGD